MRTQAKPIWRPLLAAAALPLLLSVPGSTSGAEPTGPSVEAFIDQILNTPVRVPHLVLPPQTLGHVTKIAIFGVTGFAFAAFAAPLALLCVAVLVGTWIGSRILGRVSETWFTRLYKAVLTAVALRLVLWDGIAAVGLR